MISIAIFASGSGSNALQLLSQRSQLKHTRIPLVIVDRSESPLPQKIKDLGIDIQVKVLPFLSTKAEHENRILTVLREYSIDWCFLAGFMRILGSTLLDAFQQNGRSKIVNIHPAYLPAYPGKDAYRRAFQDGVAQSGVTIHLVDAGVDTGPILVQRKFPRLESDSFESFQKRGLELEWKLYTEILHQLDEKGTLG